MTATTKDAVLVLCIGNSCRSQMAEGFLRHFAPETVEVTSAGTDPESEVHPLAIQVMAEEGIDISSQRPKNVKGFLGRISIHYLIIVCDDAQQKCPRIFPGMRERLVWPFEDPAQFTGSQDEVVAAFRRVRDEIRGCILNWLAEAR